MKVVILAGGLGTRLREETEYRPKPMVDIGGMPIVWHIMKIYAQAGFNEFVLCLGYKGQMIKEFFLNYESLMSDFTITLGGERRIEVHGNHAEQEFRVTLADTGLETMTGGRLKRIERYIDTDNFMMSYGDGLADVNVREVLDFHLAHGRTATMTAVRPFSRYGVVNINGDGAVDCFEEKPQLDGWINAGFMVLNRKVFDYLDDDSCVFEREPLERMASDEQLVAYRHEGFFFAMDTYRDYLMLNKLWNSGEAPWRLWR